MYDLLWLVNANKYVRSSFRALENVSWCWPDEQSFQLDFRPCGNETKSEVRSTLKLTVEFNYHWV